MRKEDDLRAALQTLERHTPDPDRMLAAIRASGRAAMPPRRRWRRAAGPPRNWPGRIAPLAAATAVIAVVATSVLVAKVYAPGQAGGGRPHRVSTVAPPFPTWNGLPGYFAALPGARYGAQPGGGKLDDWPLPPIRSQKIQIIATATGEVATTARLPGYVTAISASAGALFAAVVRGSVASFYEVRLAGHGASATVTKLPIPVDTAPIGYIAASPDGRKLAISTLVRHGPAADIQNLIVAATGTGAERRWRTPAQDMQGSMGIMAWLAEGKTLAFNWTGTAQVLPSTGLRLLDTSAPGSNLLSGAFLLSDYNHAGSFDDYIISPDAKTLLGIVGCLPGCTPGSPGTIQGHREVLGSLIQFAAATKASSIRYTEPELPGTPAHTVDSGCTDPMWVSNSGRRVLLACYQHRRATSKSKAVTLAHVLLLDNGTVTELPWLAGFASDQNVVTAFPGMTSYGGAPPFPLNP